MFTAPRRTCPECGREVGLTAARRLARHDAKPGSGLISCPGSKRPVPPDNTRLALDGWVPPPMPGQIALW
ncbi:hypothetical protein ACFPK5_00795 [Streptomyces beijiangensis]|uniref:hypothetical protein n=1 Tax=Streptomyces beijiangensis TaxID=163361 RepID=UPI003610B782